MSANMNPMEPMRPIGQQAYTEHGQPTDRWRWLQYGLMVVVSGVFTLIFPHYVWYFLGAVVVLAVAKAIWDVRNHRVRADAQAHDDGPAGS